MGQRTGEKWVNLLMFENKTILITGGTGSFGRAFTKFMLDKYNVKKVIIFSRDEIKQWRMKQEFNDPRLRFFIGDVRDASRLYRAFDSVDYIVHGAALKIVPTAEYDPFEPIKTNIMGTMNVINAAIDRNVEKLVALSTDKACLPVNLYGATKLVSDKLVVSGNNYARFSTTKFSVVRYGNVMGSRGSVMPLFAKQIPTGCVTITSMKMTRFMITLQQGVEMVSEAFKDMMGGEIYVKKLPSMRVIDLARAMSPNIKTKIIGIRPGEKLHEVMISKEDAPFTYEYDNHFKILPATNTTSTNNLMIGTGKLVSEDFSYSSDNNKIWMSEKDIQNWIKENRTALAESIL